MKIASLEIDLLANIARLQQDMRRAEGTVERSMRQIEGQIQRVQRAFGALGLGVGFGAMIRQVQQLADAWQGMENRLRLVTNGQRELAKATDDVFRIAQRTSSGMDSVAQVYQRFAQNAGSLGLNLSDVAKLSETVSKAVAVSGSTAAAADAALMQFGQALASGVLRGEEFNSIMEQTPALMQAIADGMGVPLGAMRALAAEGKITGDTIVQALERAADSVDERFNTRIKTVGQSFTELNNAVTRYVGQLSQSTGATSTFADVISTIADNVDGIGRSLMFLAATAIPAAVRALWSLAGAMMAVPGMTLVKVLSVAAGALLAFHDKLTFVSGAMDTLRLAWAGAAHLWSVTTDGLLSMLGSLGSTTSSVLSAMGVDAGTSATTFKDAFQGAFLFVAGVMDSMYAGFTGNLAAIGAAFRATGENIKILFQNVFNSVRETVSLWVHSLSQELNKLPGVDIETSIWVGPGDQKYKSVLEEAKRAFQEGQKVLGMRNALVQAIAQQTLEGLNDAFDIQLVDTQTAAIKKNTDELDKNKKKLTEAQKAQAAFEKERQSALRAQYAAISAIHEEASGIEDQVALYGLSRTAIEDLTIARLEEQAALLSGRAGAEEQLEIFEREIEARKRLRAAIGSMEQKEAERAAWESWSRDVEQIFNQVGQSLTDALFEGGRSGRDLIKDLFKTLTLRVLIQPVMGGLQGLFMGAGPAGIANAGSAAGMMGSPTSLFSMFGGNSMGMGISNALTSLSSSSMLAGTGVGNWMTGVAGNVAGMSNLALGGAGLLGGLGAGLLFDNKGYSSAGGGLGATAGMALGGPVGAVAGSLLGGALGSLFGDDEPRTRHAQQGAAHMLPDGTFEIAEWDDRQDTASQIAARDFAQAAVKHANDLFERIGIDAQIHSFQTLMESSILGDKQGVGSSGQVRIGDVIRDIGLTVESSWTKHGFGGWSEAEMLPRLMTDVQLTILEAFQAAGDQLPSVLSGMLEGVDIRSLGAEQAQALAQSFQLVVDQVSALQVALEQLPFEQLRDLSFDAAANLIQFAGGLEQLDAGMTSYFQNFYSEAERLDWATQQIGGAFDELGLTMPDVTQGADAAKAAYRELVESLDLTTEEGQRAYATLMTLSGGFHELVTGMDQLAQSTGNAATRFDSLISSFMGMASDALSAVQQRGQEQIERLSASFARTDSVFNAYRSQVQQLESQWGSLITTMERSMRDLRGQVDASARLQYDQARAVISTAVLTGQLPQTADLGEAIRIAQQGVAGGRYASEFDQREAYLKLANELEALQGIAQPELDTARASLEQLERQYNKLRGIEDLSDKSLVQLEKQLGVALSAEAAARVQIEQIERQIAMAQLSYQQLVGINEELSTLPGALQALANAISAANAAREAAGKTDSVSREARYLANNPDVLDAYLRGEGGNMTAEELARYHYETYGKKEGRSFDVGTSYVPYDMMANIHRGEIIIDPRSSDILRRYGIGVQGGGSSRETEQLLREQLAEVRQQNRYLYEIVKSGKRTANHTETMERSAMETEGLAVVAYG